MNNNEKIRRTGEQGSAGPLIASVIIIIVLLISAFYALKERPLKQNDVNLPIDADIQLLETQSASTEISDIEADLDATNLDDLGMDLDAAEAEL
jgi:hypothetical protein